MYSKNLRNLEVPIWSVKLNQVANNLHATKERERKEVEKEIAEKLVILMIPRPAIKICQTIFSDMRLLLRKQRV